MKTKLATALIMLMSIMQSFAVVTIGNNSNTNPPSGNRGWDTIGNWGSTTGQAIGKRHFLAAKHVGGNVGDIFTLGEIGYTTIFKTDATNGSDLTLWEIAAYPSPCFPTNRIAVMCVETNLIGKAFTVFGRGFTRGAPIFRTSEPLILTNFTKGNFDEFDAIGGSTGTHFNIQYSTNLTTWVMRPETYTVPISRTIHISIPSTDNSRMFYRTMATNILIGWGVGEYTGQLTWGTNVIAGIKEGHLYSNFDRNGGTDESCIIFGDSSGGIFIYNNSRWELAGNNKGGEYGPYSMDGGVSQFTGTMLDLSGLETGGYVFPTNQGEIPEKNYYTPIPVAWINSITGGN